MCVRLGFRRPILELRPNEVAKRKHHSMLGSSLSDRERESCGSVIARQRTPDELAPFYDLCACETEYIFPACLDFLVR